MPFPRKKQPPKSKNPRVRGLAVRRKEESFIDGILALFGTALKSKNRTERQAAKNVVAKIEKLKKAA